MGGTHVMRPLRYSINVTLDGCCDHRAIPADEDLHRHAAETLAPGRCRPLWPGDLRDDGGSVAGAGANGSEARVDAALDGALRPDDRRGEEVRRLAQPGPGGVERGARERGPGEG